MNSYKEIYKSSIDWSNVFKRTTKNPLDRSSMFNSYEDALLYAKGEGYDIRGIGGTSYVGQIISVFENGKVSVFKIIGKDEYDENGNVIVKERNLEELISSEDVKTILESYSKNVDLETIEKEINDKIDNLQLNIGDTYVTNSELTEVKETINNLSSDTNSYFVKYETLNDVQNNFNKQIEIINNLFVKNDTLVENLNGVYEELNNLDSKIITDDDLSEIINDNKINFNESFTISPYTEDNKNFTFNAKLSKEDGNILVKKEDGLFSHVNISIDNNKLIFKSNGDIQEYDIYKNVKLSNDVENILVKNDDGLFVRKPNEIQILNKKNSVIELGFSQNDQTDINYISSDVKLYDDSTNLIVKKPNADGKNTLYVSNDASKYVIEWRSPDNKEYTANVKDVLYLLKNEIDNFNGNIDLEYYD